MEWLVNLPNLHPIKNVWDYEKELLGSKWKKLRELGKDILKKTWRETVQIW